MANINAPDGFTPIDLQPQHVHRYYKSASVILAIGDPVIRATASSDPNGYPAVTRATTGGAITGVVVGVEPILSNLNQSGVYLAADTGYVLVADHPFERFIVQDDGSAQLGITNLGTNINSVAAIDANTSTGRSKYQIAGNAISAGNTWALVGYLDQPGNDPTAVNCRWIVQPNLHTENNNSAQEVTAI